MPEGHSIHRLARAHGRWLVGRAFRADAPRGGLPAEALLGVSGRALLSAGAHGKHLFLRFEGGARLHLHLGLLGRIRHFRAGAPPPSASCQLRLASPHATLHVLGAPVVEVLDAAGEAAVRARLGVDPLHPVASPARAHALLRAAPGPLAAALLEQGRLAGVGNILRAEALHLAGLPPLLPARALGGPDFSRLWEALRTLMVDAARDGRILSPGAPPPPRTEPGRRREDRYRVYGRAGQACPRCGTAVEKRALAGRALYLCPGCQGAGPSSQQA
jgi:endonuclease-8